MTLLLWRMHAADYRPYRACISTDYRPLLETTQTEVTACAGKHNQPECHPVWGGASLPNFLRWKSMQQDNPHRTNRKYIAYECFVLQEKTFFHMIIDMISNLINLPPKYFWMSPCRHVIDSGSHCIIGFLSLASLPNKLVSQSD